jgi:hypothetical protein
MLTAARSTLNSATVPAGKLDHALTHIRYSHPCQCHHQLGSVAWNTTTVNLTETDKKDLPRQTSHPSQIKGHRKSIFTETVQMPASVNKIKARSLNRAWIWPSCRRRRMSPIRFGLLLAGSGSSSLDPRSSSPDPPVVLRLRLPVLPAARDSPDPPVQVLCLHPAAPCRTSATGTTARHADAGPMRHRAACRRRPGSAAWECRSEGRRRRRGRESAARHAAFGSRLAHVVIHIYFSALH